MAVCIRSSVIFIAELQILTSAIVAEKQPQAKYKRTSMIVIQQNWIHKIRQRQLARASCSADLCPTALALGNVRVFD